ncbi:MAG: polyketide cyclase [Betaproteobacteria bacterium]|nr:MAG: polyketide cyclase [Betaproteobacteria bacterium]
MIKTIVAVVVVLLAAVLVFAATRPDSFRVQRTTSIKAPPEKIFPLVADLHGWGSWSPWDKMDPAMKRTYGGAARGKGAAYAWEGNSKVGEGRMEITEASPPSKVTIKLDFIKPLEGHNIAEFTLDPKGDSTNVTWAMYGPTAYVAKIIGIFVSMDSMIGKEFETGLANLKSIAEK